MVPFVRPCFILNDQQKQKLDVRATAEVFVRYDKESSSYLVFVPDAHKVIRSRDVNFNL